MKVLDFELFDAEEPETEAPSFFEGLVRDNVFRIGTKTYKVFNSEGAYVKLVTLVGTKGRKFYEARVTSLADSSVVEIRQVLNQSPWETGPVINSGTPVNPFEGKGHAT